MDTAGTASIAIDPTPHLIAGKLDDRYLEPVQRWVALNREMLIRYWNGEIDTGTLLLGLQRLQVPPAATPPTPAAPAAPPPR